MQSVKLAPVQHQSAPLRNKIIAALRSAIEIGVLTPGTRLIEKDLCNQLNVSRTSLREALRELQAEGIFEPMSPRGLVINVPMPASMKKSFQNPSDSPDPAAYAS